MSNEQHNKINRLIDLLQEIMIYAADSHRITLLYAVEDELEKLQTKMESMNDR